MADEQISFEVELSPYPPDSPGSIRSGVDDLVREALGETGHQDLLADKSIQVDVEENFPDGGVVVILVSIGTHLAAQVWDDIVWPRIVDRWNARRRKKDEAQGS